MSNSLLCTLLQRAAEITVLRSKSKLSSAVLGAIACTTFCAAQANATNYYVSPSGNNTDGLTYASAWTTFSKINWSKATGGTIIIDGGTNGITYNDTLRVPAGSVAVTAVQGSQDPGHSGKVTLDGQQSLAIGVDLGSPVNISGATVNGILVQNYTGTGVKLEPGAIRTVVRNMEITSNNFGLWVVNGQNGSLQGTAPWLDFLTVHDNTSYQVIAQSNCQLVGSWIYGSGYPLPFESATVGAQLNNQASSGGSASNQPSVYQCVFGPGLSYGLIAGELGQQLTVGQCLFIDSAVSNFVIKQPNNPGPTQYTLTNCTSFMTAQNANGQGHCAIADKRTGQSGPLSITRSIVYGGVVNVPATDGGSGPNVEYSVTGDTTFLAGSQVNPQFITNVGALPNNTPLYWLTNADFAPAPKSPATGYGSTQVTSVYALQQLLTVATPGAN